MELMDKIDFVVQYERKNFGGIKTDLSNCDLVARVYTDYISDKRSVKTVYAMGKKITTKNNQR